MTILATETHVRGNVVKHEYLPDLGYCKKLVIVNDTAGTLEMGRVLGKVTANGKFKRAVETAVDGSKVAAAVVVEAKTIPGTTDTEVLCLVRGPSGVAKGGLVLDATYNDAPKVAAVYAALEALGVQCLDTI